VKELWHEVALPAHKFGRYNPLFYRFATNITELSENVIYITRPLIRELIQSE